MDCLIIAGDNIFTSNLKEMRDRFLKIDLPLIGVYDTRSKELTKHCASIALGKDGRIIKFEEKPKRPNTTLAAACTYMLPKRILPTIQTYVTTQKEKDSPKRFIEWLVKRESVHGHILKGFWCDIGTPNSYRLAKKFSTMFNLKT